MLLLLSLACSAPVEAPEDFNELLSYLFENTMNDDETLIAGANNLLDFAANNDERLREGYAVDNVDEKAILGSTIFDRRFDSHFDFFDPRRKPCYAARCWKSCDQWQRF